MKVKRELRDRVESWVKKNFPKNGKIKAVVTHGGLIREILKIWAPSILQQAVVYDHGNIVAQTGLVLMQWKLGKNVASELLSPNPASFDRIRMFHFQLK